MMMTPSTRPSRAAGSSKAATKPYGRNSRRLPSKWPGLLQPDEEEEVSPCRSAGGTTRTTSTRGWSRVTMGRLTESVSFGAGLRRHGVSEEAGRAAGRSRVGGSCAAAAKEGGLGRPGRLGRRRLGRGRRVRGRRHVYGWMIHQNWRVVRGPTLYTTKAARPPTSS